VGALGYGFALVLVDGPSPVDKLVIPLTLLFVVICGTLCGGALPLVFRRLGLDPALMSNPFVAGIIDITGIVIYMTVCVVVLKELRAP
jgi:magnesium transporter